VGIGIPELLILLLIVVLIFGANRLPQIGKGLGEGIKNFKLGMRDRAEIDVTPKQGSESDPQKKS
jgi:sec-independent protein translocase protein TatA